MGLAIFFGLVLISAIIGTCQEGSQTSLDPAPATPSPSTSGTGNAAHDQLIRLSDPERNSLLTNFMAGEKCGTVTRNFYQGMGNGEAFWNVQCSNGATYVIQIKPDATGSTSILDCGVLKAVGGGECFKKFE
jgi:hypothetical protein